MLKKPGLDAKNAVLVDGALSATRRVHHGGMGALARPSDFLARVLRALLPREAASRHAPAPAGSDEPRRQPLETPVRHADRMRSVRDREFHLLRKALHARRLARQQEAGFCATTAPPSLAPTPTRESVWTRPPHLLEKINAVEVAMAKSFFGASRSSMPAWHETDSSFASTLPQADASLVADLPFGPDAGLAAAAHTLGAEGCEDALIFLRTLLSASTDRHTAHVLWSAAALLLKAQGNRSAFIRLAAEYRVRFGGSAVLSPAACRAATLVLGNPSAANPWWRCPTVAGRGTFHQLAHCLTQLPNVCALLDWRFLQQLDEDSAASALDALTQSMKSSGAHLGLDRLCEAVDPLLKHQTPPVTQTWWLVRLQLLRLEGRPRHLYDRAAAKYAAMFRTPAPAWQPQRPTAPLHGIHGELVGELRGDCSDALQRLAQAGEHSPLLRVDCSRLVRVDRPAAARLRSWAANKLAKPVELLHLHPLLHRYLSDVSA